MLLKLPKCVFKKALLYNAFRRSPPWQLQSCDSIYKRSASSASQLAGQSEYPSLSRSDDCSIWGGKVLRDKDDSTSKFSDSSFHFVKLRDSCSCNRCVNPSTSQKLFETADIPENIQGNVSRNNMDGTVTVSWQNDIIGYENHLSVYPSHFIEKTSFNSRTAFNPGTRPIPRIPWNQEIMATHSTPCDYNTFLSSSSELFRTLSRLQAVGLIFLCNVPPDPDAINRIVNRIGIIRNTVYGSIWDVRSVPSPKNVAYTSTSLGFHMDLLYLAHPPEIQMLHCMTSSKQGGESLFSDTYHAVELIRQERSSLLQSLIDYPITYWYRNNGFNFEQTRPTIEMERFPVSDGPPTDDDSYLEQIKAVNWSPPFQAPLLYSVGSRASRSGTSNSLADYLKAIKAFKRVIENPASVFETKLEEGMCVIFNNRRLVHARRAFQDEGKRLLRGAYVDQDCFRNRLRTLGEELGTGTIV